MAHAHQNQLPAIPYRATIPETTRGVSAANVVAAIDVPSHHQGSPRSATKYDSIDLPAERETAMPTPRARAR